MQTRLSRRLLASYGMTVPNVERPRSAPCVLIVEDDNDVREMMDLLLTSMGYRTLTAPNGAVALDRLRQDRPCMVLLDLMMPVMTGWEFRERQLADPQLASIPVLCMSAVYQPDEVKMKLQVNCLTKPLDFGRLIDEITSACGRP
jgi:CheY-like chemotaxis protein